jgi:hypothetical protein
VKTGGKGRRFGFSMRLDPANTFPFCYLLLSVLHVNTFRPHWPEAQDLPFFHAKFWVVFLPAN